MKLKPGQTIRIGSQWGTISYFIGGQIAVVMLDDMSHVQVNLENLEAVKPGPRGPVQNERRPRV